MTENGFFAPSDYDDDSMFFAAVILPRYKGKWILSRHKSRTTWEIPGGHREEGEKVFDTAKRELFEETGALEYELYPVARFSRNGRHQMLHFAEVTSLGTLPEGSEISEILITDELPENLTYPEVHTLMFEFIKSWLASRNMGA